MAGKGLLGMESSSSSLTLNETSRTSFTESDRSGNEEDRSRLRKSRKHFEQVRINDVDDGPTRRSRVNYGKSLDIDVKPTTMRGVPLEVLTAKSVLRGFYVTKAGVWGVEETTGVSLEDFGTTESVEVTTMGTMTTAKDSTEVISGKINDFSITEESVNPTAGYEATDFGILGEELNTAPIGSPTEDGIKSDGVKETTIADVLETGQCSENDSYAMDSSVTASLATTVIPKTVVPFAETTDSEENWQMTVSLEESSSSEENLESYDDSITYSTTSSPIHSTFASRGRNRGRIRSRPRSTTSSYDQSINSVSTSSSRSRGRNHRRTTTLTPEETHGVLDQFVEKEHISNLNTELNETDAEQSVVGHVSQGHSSILTTLIPSGVFKTTSVTQTTIEPNENMSNSTDAVFDEKFVSKFDSPKKRKSDEHNSQLDVTTVRIENIPRETVPVSVETTAMPVTSLNDEQINIFGNSDETVGRDKVVDESTRSVFDKEMSYETKTEEVPPEITEQPVEDSEAFRYNITLDTTEKTTFDEETITEFPPTITTEIITALPVLTTEEPLTKLLDPTTKETITEYPEATTTAPITDPPEVTTAPQRTSILDPSRLKQSRRRQKIRLNQSGHDFGRKSGRRPDIRRRPTNRKYGPTSSDRATLDQFNIRRRGNTVFRGRRPPTSSPATSESVSGEVTGNATETGSLADRIIPVRKTESSEEEESEEGKDHEEQETTEFPAEVERADEVNLKNAGLSTRNPGSLLANRLRKPNAGTQTTSKLPSTVAGHRKTRPHETTTPTTIQEDDIVSNQTEPPKAGKEREDKPEVDQSSRAQELAVTLADPPSSSSSSSSSDTGRGPLIKDTYRRRISTTIAPRTTTLRPVRNRHKLRKDAVVQNSTIRPRRPPVIDYDYYEDEEEPIVGKSTLNGKLFLTSKGTVRCLEQGNFPHPFSCKKFITCARMVNGQVIGAEYTCPDKLSFDPVGGICNWSAGLGCKE